MQAKVLQPNLAKGVGLVSRAVASRSTLPIIGNILLAANNGRLQLAATNLEMSLTCWIGATVEAEGAITVPARTLSDLAPTLPGETVTLSRSQSTLRLTCGRFKANLKGIPADEFPKLPTLNQDTAIQFQASELRAAIRQVAFGVSTDQARPALTGVLLEMRDQQATLAAADGFRLAVRTISLSTPVVSPMSAIIPVRALDELARVLDSDEPVFMSLLEHGPIVFRNGGLELTAQLIEATYPDYRRIIPTNHTTRVVLTTSEFRKACKTADIFARESAHTLRLKIEPDGRVIVSAVAAETGDNLAELDAMVEGTESIEIAFNARYLLDALEAIDTQQVALEVTMPTSPATLKPVGRDDQLYVVMPMQVQ